MLYTHYTGIAALAAHAVIVAWTAWHRRSNVNTPHRVAPSQGGILNLGKMSPTPNPSPVKREGLPEPVFPFPSLRGEGAGVSGPSEYLPLNALGGEGYLLRRMAVC